MTQKLHWKHTTAIHIFFWVAQQKIRWCSLLLLASWYFRISAVFGLCEPGDVLWKPGMAHLGAWWCHTQIKHARPLDEESRPQAEIFSNFSPFCQVLDIWEKGQGWTIQPNDTGFVMPTTCRFYNIDAWLHRKKHPNPGRRRRWCILGWRLEVSVFAHFLWVSVTLSWLHDFTWQLYAIEGIGATPTTGTHSLLAVYGALAKASDLIAHVKLLQKTTNIWFVQKLCSELQIACFFISNFAGHALEIIGGIRSPLSIESGCLVQWTTACHGCRGAAKKIFVPWTHGISGCCDDFLIQNAMTQTESSGLRGMKHSKTCVFLWCLGWFRTSHHISIVIWEFLEANALDGALYKPFQWWVRELSWKKMVFSVVKQVGYIEQW